MDYIPEVYNEIEVGTRQPSACSPTVPRSPWHGIVINAPEKITPVLGEAMVIPVCGYYLISVLAIMDGSPLSVRVDLIDTDISYTGFIQDDDVNSDDEPDVAPPDDAPVNSREDLEGVLTGGYFNIDITSYLPHGLFTGTFDITMCYAGSNSEPVRIVITEPKEPK